MIVVAAILFGLAAGFLRGGSIGSLGRLPLRGVWLLFLGLLVQLLIFPSFLWSPAPIRTGVGFFHIVSYALTIAFLLWNWRTLWPVVPGMVLNVAPIVANGGYMPASVAGLRSAGLHDAADALVASNDGTLGNIVLMSEQTHFNVLGDWIYVAEWVPLATSFSIGDVLIIAGVAWVIQAGMVRTTGRDRTAPSDSPPAGES